MTGNEIIRSAKLCVYSYDTIEEIRYDGKIGEPSATHAVSIGSASAFGYILRDDKNVDIVIRGTNDPLDIIRDMDLAQVNHHIYYHVHRGVLTEWNALKSQVFAIIRPGDRIRLHGHSLGGGIVNLALIDLLNYDKIKSVDAITFGQLMIFGEDAAENYSELPLLRVRNARDRVPSLPSAVARSIYSWGYKKVFKESMDVPPYYFTSAELWLTSNGRAKPAWPYQYSGHAIKKYWKKSKTQLANNMN